MYWLSMSFLTCMSVNHRVVSNWDLSQVLITDTVLELGKVTYAHGWMCICVEFRDEILFKEGRM